MKTTTLGKSNLTCSRLAYGCWRLAGNGDNASDTAGREAILAAYEAGYTLFDHADIYCDGQSETLFGRVLKEKPDMRDHILIASKCGVVKPTSQSPDTFYRYDSSADYIRRACEGSLKRLGVDTIDLYMIHRPDYLMAPAEVAQAFSELLASGKVRFFGVSNFSPSQLTALRTACPMPLVVNQIEVSLLHQAPFDDGSLDQCLSDQITPLAWSPLAGGKLADGAARVLPAQEGYQAEPALTELDRLAALHGSSRTVLSLAWLLRHPSGILPIVGSSNPERIRHAARASDLDLSREDWYRLLVAARDQRLP